MKGECHLEKKTLYIVAVLILSVFVQYCVAITGNIREQYVYLAYAGT